mmetsp:Transcript_147072/g.256797  ORF Transcript_147072/g.256797 Transcript_147072/m.256797 type:complete len:229 (+) Transcript_147072:530-1216(+)
MCSTARHGRSHRSASDKANQCWLRAEPVRMGRSSDTLDGEGHTEGRVFFRLIPGKRHAQTGPSPNPCGIGPDPSGAATGHPLTRPLGSELQCQRSYRIPSVSAPLPPVPLPICCSKCKRNPPPPPVNSPPIRMYAILYQSALTSPNELQTALSPCPWRLANRFGCALGPCAGQDPASHRPSWQGAPYSHLLIRPVVYPHNVQQWFTVNTCNEEASTSFRHPGAGSLEA